MTSTAICYSRKLQRVQMWEKLKNNSPNNDSCICQKTVTNSQKIKVSQQTTMNTTTRYTVVGIYKPLMHPLVQLTLHVYP